MQYITTERQNVSFSKFVMKMKYQDFFPFLIISIYIMHENPIYNLTFLKHQFDRSLRLTPHKLIDDLQSSYEVYLTPVVSDTLGDIVRKVNFR